MLVKNEDGTTSEIMSYTGRWDELPEFSLIDREDVTVDVDFTDIEAVFSHGAALTLSDYMELQALKAFASVAPGVKIVDIGPAYYQKFPLAGELASFPVFDDSFSLGSVDIINGLWDGSFVIEAAPGVEVALDTPTSELSLTGLVQIADGSAAPALADSIIVIGDYAVGAQTRQDVASVDYIDEGSGIDFELSTSYLEGFPLVQLTTAVNLVRQADPTQVTTVDDVVVMQGSSYRLKKDGSRRFAANSVQNDGQIDGDGFLEFAARGSSLTIEGDGTIDFNAPGKIAAQLLVHGEGHTIRFNAFDPNDLPSTGVEDSQWPEVPAGAVIDPVLGRQLNGSSDYTTGRTPFVSEHEFNVQALDNSGTIVFNGKDFDLAFTELNNQPTGTLRVEGDTSVSLNDSGNILQDLRRNSGVIEAVGPDAYLDVRYVELQGETAPGKVVAKQGATVEFT
ncbi:MAG: hypothetical protein AAF211_30350, partial [Myxococcota bacterium]